MKKSALTVLLSFLTLVLFCVPVSSAEYSVSIDAKSAILIEVSSGTVLFEQNADEALPPASVTKIMTLLLVMEAIDAGKLQLDSTVTASARAASMGGSQIYLKEGEEMSCEDLLKSVVIASANDAAVALGEAVAGSEEQFVIMMNERAAELGMVNTHFENTNGLDDTVKEHVTSARDIAIMSRELITKHKKILEYSSIWMDTVRNGEFTLTNTNRLIRFYNGANGLKTGSTARAKFCISASAERNGMQLIAVIMGAPTRDQRNEAAKALLDFGFANYALYSDGDTEFSDVKVVGGVSDRCSVTYEKQSFIVERGTEKNVKVTIETESEISAPIKKGEQIGRIVYTLDGKELYSVPIVANESVERISFGNMLLKVLEKIAFTSVP